MFTSDSRYASQKLLDHTDPAGRPVRHVTPRLLPDPDAAQIALRHRATDSDRLDLTAYRHLGVPTAWWMIADANRAVHPGSLGGVPGEIVSIPVPGTGRIAG